MTLKVTCGLRLGSPLCHPHRCICGVMVESNGRHGLTCKMQMGRRSRHDQINDLIRRSLVQGKVPAVNEPSGLSRADGKRPDGLTLTTWKSGKCLIWDVTVADTLCQSYIDQTSKSAGAAADIRETQKTSKYTELAENYTFSPIGVETRVGKIPDIVSPVPAPKIGDFRGFIPEKNTKLEPPPSPPRPRRF